MLHPFKKKRNQGLTIIELAIVVSIMGLFLSVILTASQLFIKKVRLYQCHNNLEKIYEYMEIYLYESAGKVGDISSSNSDIPAGHILKKQLLSHFKSPADQIVINQIFRCPADPRPTHIIDLYGSYDLRAGILHNTNKTGLSGKNFFFTKKRASIIMMGDFRTGWHNLSWNSNKISVIYMDGKVDHIEEKNWQNNLKMEVNNLS